MSSPPFTHGKREGETQGIQIKKEEEEEIYEGKKTNNRQTTC